MFITLTRADTNIGSPISINISAIVTMSDAYVVGQGSGGTTIMLNFTGTDKSGIHVAESRAAILAEIERLRERS